MRRLIPAFGGIRWPDQAIRLAKWQNPVVASPAAPLETVAAMLRFIRYGKRHEGSLVRRRGRAKGWSDRCMAGQSSSVLVVEVDAGGGHHDEDRCGDQVDAAPDGQDDWPAVRHREADVDRRYQG